MICTDKTGTLTAGKMTATVLRLADREVQVGADGTDPRVSLALRIGALANEASLGHSSEGWRAHGDPTDVALLLAAARGGVDRERLLLESPRHRELPFSSERLLAASWHHDGPGLTLFVKGAPGRVLELSDRVLTAHGTGPLTAESRDSLLEANRELAARGLRVLALAMKEDARGGDADLQGLTWVAFVGLSDPPAAGVRETIDVFSRAGIRTVMITGDQQRTAEALARELGLARAGDRVLDGRELDRMSDDELRSEVDGSPPTAGPAPRRSCGSSPRTRPVARSWRCWATG